MKKGESIYDSFDVCFCRKNGGRPVYYKKKEKRLLCALCGRKLRKKPGAKGGHAKTHRERLEKLGLLVRY